MGRMHNYLAIMGLALAQKSANNLIGRRSNRELPSSPKHKANKAKKKYRKMAKKSRKINWGK